MTARRALCLISLASLLVLSFALAGEVASAQTADRTIEEIRTETLARAQTGAYPALGIQPADAAEALGRIKTRDGDEWAAAWSAVADGYMAKARAARNFISSRHHISQEPGSSQDPASSKDLSASR